MKSFKWLTCCISLSKSNVLLKKHLAIYYFKEYSWVMRMTVLTCYHYFELQYCKPVMYRNFSIASFFVVLSKLIR